MLGDEMTIIFLKPFRSIGRSNRYHQLPEVEKFLQNI
jgi:hypothetical protein